MLLSGPRLIGDIRECAAKYDRQPFGFEHGLGELELFNESTLRELAAAYEGDFFVAAGARSPGTGFYSVPSGMHTPLEAFDRLDAMETRILLKRPEERDPRFRELLESLFDQIGEMRGALGHERIVRLASSILISSAATLTPFHFDPEVTFFFQVAGEKIYHLYEPAVLSEAELERFYVAGIVDIGQVDFDGRDPAREHSFELVAGKGLHQPQNCPHWVQTRASRSISYAISYETDATRSLGRTRAFNHYLRRLGFRPSRPGSAPRLDAGKAKAMEFVIPLRKTARTLIRRAIPARAGNARV
jgi:hypothetical protein